MSAERSTADDAALISVGGLPLYNNAVTRGVW